MPRCRLSITCSLRLVDRDGPSAPNCNSFSAIPARRYETCHSWWRTDVKPNAFGRPWICALTALSVLSSFSALGAEIEGQVLGGGAPIATHRPYRHGNCAAIEEIDNRRAAQQ